MELNPKKFPEHPNSLGRVWQYDVTDPNQLGREWQYYVSDPNQLDENGSTTWLTLISITCHP